MNKAKKKEKKSKKAKQFSQESFEAENDSTSPNYLSFWMSYLPETILLRDLIIPGAHVANSHDLYQPRLMLPFSRCQKLSITRQLEAGIRFLDLRYGLSSKKIFRKLGIDKYL